MKLPIKTILDYGLRLLIVGGCLAYAFWGIDLAGMARAMAAMSPVKIVLLMAYQFLGFYILGLRLRFITSGDCGVGVGSKASMLALGLNNVFPAKLGEVAKAIYLSRTCGFSGARGLGVVFWERFFDLNTVLLMALISTMLVTVKQAIIPIAVVVGGLWVVVILLRVWPGAVRFFSRLVPFERGRVFLSDLGHQVRQQVSPGFFVKLAGYSIITWLQYMSVFYFAINWLAGLGLTPGQVLVVFVVGALGMAVPSSPAAVGVFEAAMVFGFGLWGVGREEALAAGLVIHAIQFVPTTVSGLAVFATSGLSMKALRRNL